MRFTITANMDRMDLEPITIMDDAPQLPGDFDWGGGGDVSPHGVDEVDRGVLTPRNFDHKA